MSMRLGSVRGFGVRGSGFVIAIAIGFGPLTNPEVRAQEPSALGAITLDGLLRMSPAELETVYRQGTATAIPDGRIRGTALWRRGPGGRVLCRAAHGCSGRGRCSSPGRPRPSIASSDCG